MGASVAALLILLSVVMGFLWHGELMRLLPKPEPRYGRLYGCLMKVDANGVIRPVQYSDDTVLGISLGNGLVQIGSVSLSGSYRYEDELG